MGIRITKAIGYGLTGLSIDPNNYMATDDARINLRCPAITYEHEAKDSDGAYLERLKIHTNKMNDPEFYSSPEFSLIFSLRSLEIELGGENAHESFTLMDNIIYDGEYGDPGTLLIIPPGMHKSWHRSGDHIDSMEASLEDTDNTDPSVKILPFPPYPFDGMMDARTGEQISEELSRKLRSIKTLERAIKRSAPISDQASDDITKGLELLREDASKSVGCKDYGEFQRIIVPAVPIEVRDFVEWAGIFNNPESWKDLRPMIYTYWA